MLRSPSIARVVPELRVRVPEVKLSEVSDLRNWVESRESRVSASPPVSSVPQTSSPLVLVSRAVQEAKLLKSMVEELKVIDSPPSPRVTWPLTSRSWLTTRSLPVVMLLA